MKFQPKEGVDWVALRAEWEAEKTSFRQLAEKYGVSQQAISKRCKKENWRNEQNNLVGRMPNWRTLVKQCSTAKTGSKGQGAGLHGDYVQLMTDILRYIAEGTIERIAAEAAGVPERTWKHWKQHDEKLRALVDQARGLRARRRINSIERSSDNGDWRAAAYLLERSPETKEDFAKPDESGGPVQVIINVERGDLNDTRVIDGTPDKPRLPSD